MLGKLLIILLICQQPNEIDFGSFNKKKDPNVIKKTSPSFPAQSLPKVIADSLPKINKKEVPQVLYATDKFGQRWQHTNQEALNNFIKERNKIPFISTDKRGYRWFMDNKEELDKFIKRQNDYYDYLDSQPKTSYVPAGTVYYNAGYCPTGTS